MLRMEAEFQPDERMPEISYTDRRLNELKLRWEQDPTSRVYLQLADEYRKLGRQDEAVAVLTTGLKRRPNDLAALVALGRCRLELGELEAAAQTLENVIGRDPTHLVANRWLIEAYLKGAHAEKAGERLEIYRLLNDRDPEIEQLDYRLRQLRSDHRPAPAPPAAAPPPAGEVLAAAPGPEPEVAEPAPEPSPFAMAPPPPEPAPAPEPSPFAMAPPPVPPQPEPSPFAMAPPPAPPQPEPSPSPFAMAPPPPVRQPEPEPSPFAMAPPPAQQPEPSPFAMAPPQPEVAAAPATSPSGDDIFQLDRSVTTETPALAGGDIFQLGEMAPPPAPTLADLWGPAPSAPASPATASTPSGQDVFSLTGDAPEPFPEPPEPPPAPGPPAAAPGEAAFPSGVDTTVGALPAEPEAGDAIFETRESAVAEVPLPSKEALTEPEAAPPADLETATATLGELYLKQGYLAEAAKIFRQVLGQDPENLAAMAGLQRIESMGRAGLTAPQLLARYGGEGLYPEGLTAKKILVLEGYLKHLRGAGQAYVH